MASSEIPYTRTICDLLRNHNAEIIPYVASERNRPNVPDRIIWHRYWHGFIEFKGVDTAIRPGQRILINELNKRVPGSAFVVRAATLVKTNPAGFIQTSDGVTLAEFVTVLEMLHDLRELTKRWQETGSE